MRKRKTLDDFPKFMVAVVRRRETSATGYTRFELEGEFDQIIPRLSPYWFWLLIDENDCICASVNSLDKDTWIAVLSCDEKEEPNVAGKTLYYLSPYWQAFNVWMVLDLNWGWKKIQFYGADAVAEDYEAKEISIVSGREVRIWTKIEPADKSSHTTRYYPADDQTSPPKPGTRIIPGGWGHEHCDLCRAHIDAGRFGYRDPDNRWMCESCYEKYVVPRDLAFVDEL